MHADLRGLKRGVGSSKQGDFYVNGMDHPHVNRGAGRPMPFARDFTNKQVLAGSANWSVCVRIF